MHWLLYSFWESGGQEWVPYRADIKMLIQDEFSSGGVTGEGSTSKLSQADGRIYFLMAVQFITA